MFFDEKLKLADIEIEDGYTLTNAIYSAMSSDYRYWEMLIQSQVKKVKELSHSKQVREMGKTIFFVQDITSPNARINKEKIRLMNECTWVYSGDSPCFHAKLAILRYEKKMENSSNKVSIAYLIAVMSKNMVCNDSDDQNIIWQWVKVKGDLKENATTNRKRLWEYIQYCANNCRKNIYGENKDEEACIAAFEDIQYIETNNFDILFNGIDKDEQLYTELFKEPYSELIAVCKSYFVGQRYRELAAYSNSKLSIYTKYKKDDQDVESDGTHMKLYFKIGCDNKSYFYSGSANLSENALCNKNVECLVRTEMEENDIRTIIGNLKKRYYHKMDTEWPNPIQPGDERSDENEAINAILNIGWKWASDSDSKFYIADNCGKRAVRAEHTQENVTWIYEVTPLSFYENYGENDSDTVQKPEEAVLILRKEPDYSVCRIKIFRPLIEENLKTEYEAFDFEKELYKSYREEVNKTKRIISECYKIKMREQYKKVTDKMESLDEDALDESVKKSLNDIKKQIKDVWGNSDDGK